MPAIYAHHKFGQLVKSHLAGPEREWVESYGPMFEIGLQGPDFLFFYKALSKNRVNQLGYQMHREPAARFLSRSLPVVLENQVSYARYTYLMGFICHFMLDSQCHPYIGRQEGEIGVGHIEIESELDKSLLRKDGKDPIACPLYDLVPSDRVTASLLAPLYPELTGQEVERALCDMRFYKKLLTAPGAGKRRLLIGAMKATGNYDSLHGHIYMPENHPDCEETVARLTELLGEALEMTVEILGNFRRFVFESEVLSPRFERNFE